MNAAYSKIDRAVEAGLWNLAFQLVDPRFETPLDIVHDTSPTAMIHLELRAGICHDDV